LSAFAPLNVCGGVADDVADSQRAGRYRSGPRRRSPVAYAAHISRLTPIVERIA